MKMLKMMMIIFCIFLLIPQQTFALTAILDQGNNWEQTGKQEAQKGTTIDSIKLQDASNSVFNLFMGAATIISVIIGALLGIQYMTAGIDKKVDVKKSFVPYLISVIIVFGSVGIWKLVITVMEQVK